MNETTGTGEYNYQVSSANSPTLKACLFLYFPEDELGIFEGSMVFYFKSNGKSNLGLKSFSTRDLYPDANSFIFAVVTPPYTIFMGLDKHESE